MKHQLGKIRVSDTAKALRLAERQLKKPQTNGAPEFVQVKPQDIKTRVELFQPRRPGWGTRELDTKHVGKLATRIERKGELDPVLVVRLGDQWVVVDGHHRVAAYLKKKRKAAIKCEWFAGTVREAMDAALARNEKTHLEVDQGDKHEAAWLRTLLDWDGDTWRTSKQAVVQLTGAGEGTVAQMRRCVRCHENYNKKEQSTEDRLLGEKLHNKFGADLTRHTWSDVNRVRLDLTPKEWDINDAAAKLAKNLVTRMTTKLSDDPEVTARALWLYDRDMCPKLITALEAQIRKTEQDEKAEAGLQALEAMGAMGGQD
ncbi:ParB/RepB/Spo0J family partition protein [Bradyrhizobium sp.]|uniref:ParB/RepB/Spo0J family partition protein n=1 Tax=Bradyrhizobium sp. TaxID=376 RepID=UPI001DBDD5C4|nr:ParB/RepB/Spo0J family partition protein [Bradyrhizobium sp.]MBI5322736.1 ParB N-terminal domain-containing protein [Bradyrhizobium sp.]